MRERGTITQQRFRAGVRRMSSSQRQKLSEALKQNESLQYKPNKNTFCYIVMPVHKATHCASEKKNTM